MAKKKWSYTTGEKGRNRVRAFKDDKTGIILLEFYSRSLGATEPKRERVSTGHRDEVRAKQQADELAAKISQNEPPPTKELTLRSLFDIYLREVTPGKGESKRKHDHRSAEMFVVFLGAGRKAGTLNRRDWDRFAKERRSGVIAPAGVKRKREVRARIVAYDLKWLLSVLNWATTAGDNDGGVLLERNPLRGLSLPTEESPVRPVLMQEQYEALLGVADSVNADFRIALVLCHETGHRVGAVRMLRWSDIDLEKGSVRWRGENDKIGYEHTTFLSDGAKVALSELRKQRPAIGDAWLFPSPEDASKPRSRYDLSDWWRRGAKRANLPKGQRLGWHSLRRKFATEMKHTPLSDLSQLGVWKCVQTILTCYQRPDEATQRKALEGRTVLRAVNG
jgi:integrase